MTTFSVNPDLLCAVASCASTEETRHYLHGVRIEPHKDGVLLIATDGHTMAIGYDESGTIDVPATIALNWKDPALKSGRAGRLRLDGEDRMGRIRRAADEPSDPEIGVVLVEYPDQNFPDWTRVIPSAKVGAYTSNAFSATYLARFAAATKRAGLRSDTGVHLLQAQPGDPAWARTGDDRLASIIMPMRWPESDIGRPGWL